MVTAPSQLLALNDFLDLFYKFPCNFIADSVPLLIFTIFVFLIHRSLLEYRAIWVEISVRVSLLSGRVGVCYPSCFRLPLQHRYRLTVFVYLS